jgi:hypothetical protein
VIVDDLNLFWSFLLFGKIQAYYNLKIGLFPVQKKTIFFEIDFYLAVLK